MTASYLNDIRNDQIRVVVARVILTAQVAFTNALNTLSSQIVIDSFKIGRLFTGTQE